MPRMVSWVIVTDAGVGHQRSPAVRTAVRVERGSTLQGPIDLPAVDAGLGFDLGQAGVGHEHLDSPATGDEGLALRHCQRARIELWPG